MTSSCDQFQYDHKCFPLPKSLRKTQDKAAYLDSYLILYIISVILKRRFCPQDFSEEPTEHPKLKEINDRLRERQETQQAREQTVKTELIQKATSHLEKFYAVSLPSPLSLPPEVESKLL